MSELTFCYDFSSPYAYLGATQVERVARAHGATVVWKPILVGALFNSIGTPNVPIAEFPQPKREYYQRDMMHWAAHWEVPFRFPSRFPMRTVTALRLALAHAAAGGDIADISHRIFRAYWVDDRDIADPDVLRQFGDLAAADAPSVKQALRSNTDEAIAAGACGVPTFVVRGHVFWGQDRLDLVGKTLAGWDPPG